MTSKPQIKTRKTWDFPGDIRDTIVLMRYHPDNTADTDWLLDALNAIVKRNLIRAAIFIGLSIGISLFSIAVTILTIFIRAIS